MAAAAAQPLCTHLTCWHRQSKAWGSGEVSLYCVGPRVLPVSEDFGLGEKP